MTEKLYYQDPYVREFDASIMDIGMDENGHQYVVLDKTAFYPTGGGQPNDTGKIGGATVVNVEEVEGEVLHYIDGTIPSGSKEARCEIHWSQRFDHMQHHCGQHILSAAFAEKFGMETIGFHLGKEIATIDLNVDRLNKETVREAEALANQIISENRPIETKWVTSSELKDYPLRKAVTVKEDIRLVIIPDFDYNGCGGTHPAFTGEVGVLKVIGWEKNKGGTRLSFICGSRVVEQMDQQLTILQELRRLLNTDDTSLHEKVKALLDEKKTLEFSLKDASERLLQMEAYDLVNRSKSTGNFPIVKGVFQGRSMKDIQLLSKLITEEEMAAIVLFVIENDDKLQVLCARGKDSDMDMNAIIQKGLKHIDGKGGGNAERAQGGGVSSTTGEKMLDIMMTYIRKD